MKRRSIFSSIITKRNYGCRRRGLSTGSMLTELEFKDYLRIARIECAGHLTTHSILQRDGRHSIYPYSFTIQHIPPSCLKWYVSRLKGNLLGREPLL